MTIIDRREEVVNIVWAILHDLAQDKRFFLVVDRQQTEEFDFQTEQGFQNLARYLVGIQEANSIEQGDELYSWLKPNHYTLEIECNNDAFTGEVRAELSNILRRISTRILDGGLNRNGEPTPVFDSNGNCVGREVYRGDL